MVFQHETVLLQETIEALQIKPDGVYVDATLGGAGHSELLLSKLSDQGHLYSFDQDQLAIDHARNKLATLSDGITLIKSNFRYLSSALTPYGVKQVDGILYDLGVSSPQFDEAQRGFSYKLEAKLDMRMDQNQTLTAYDVVNGYPFGELLRIFTRYGESKFAKVLARKIEKQRQIKPIESTLELAELIKAALPQKELKKKGHPAKTIFQALRIEVNDELGSLSDSLEQAIVLLKPQGRLAVISFHSLEDRLVKQIFREYTEVEVPRGLPELPDNLRPMLEILTKKPIVASEEEQLHNHRAHSAKLRVAERTTFHSSDEIFTTQIE